jgi:lipopolysaccharide transport system ATP-binding protein
MSDVVISVRSLSKCFAIYDKTYHPLLDVLFRGRRKFHREFWALKDVSFDVARGETIGIIGRNGSGKSTLLQLVFGTLAASSGSVEARGRISALLELGSGFNPAFTGRENVFMNGAILGLRSDEVASRLDEIVAFAEIGEFLDQPVRTYSSGMFVRLAFAVAINTSPDILIVDEALAVGDTAFQSRCLARIREMQQNGTAILLVTHSTNTINEYCDRAIYLKRGRLIEDGPCKRVTESYAADLVKDENSSAVTLSASGSDASGSEILKVWIEDRNSNECRIVHQADRFTVRLRVKFNRLVAKPCLGIQLKSTGDIELWSATTPRLGIEIASAATGEIRDYAWSLTAQMGAGRYVVALGVGEIEGGLYKRHSRLHYATHFDVSEDKQTGWGWLAPDPEVALVAVVQGDQ